MGEDYLRRAHTITPVENPYNLCARTQESLFGAFDELRVGLVVHCPLAQGPAHGCLCEGRNLWGRRLECLHGERRLDRAHGVLEEVDPARAAVRVLHDPVQPQAEPPWRSTSGTTLGMPPSSA